MTSSYYHVNEIKEETPTNNLFHVRFLCHILNVIVHSIFDDITNMIKKKIEIKCSFLVLQLKLEFIKRRAIIEIKLDLNNSPQC